MKKVLFTLFLSGFTGQTILSQGCSDAGFCTISTIKPKDFSETFSKNENQLKIGFFFGSADKSVSVWGNYTEYNNQVSDKLSLDVRLTSISQIGNGIRTFGLGDVLLLGNYNLGNQLKASFGTKIPLTKANKQNNGYSLPMDYQSSLGTLDVIMALNFQKDNWQFSVGWQQPLTQNENSFLAENHVNPHLRKFESTKNFVRSGDVLLRVSYPISIIKKLKLTPSVLPIYHLTNDTYTDALGNAKTIINSKGLTLNTNLYIDYQINTKKSLQVNIGVPFITRKVRPDGLTRHFIVNLEYRVAL